MVSRSKSFIEIGFTTFAVSGFVPDVSEKFKCPSCNECKKTKQALSQHMMKPVVFRDWLSSCFVIGLTVHFFMIRNRFIRNQGSVDAKHLRISSAGNFQISKI